MLKQVSNQWQNVIISSVGINELTDMFIQGISSYIKFDMSRTIQTEDLFDSILEHSQLEEMIDNITEFTENKEKELQKLTTGQQSLIARAILNHIDLDNKNLNKIKFDELQKEIEVVSTKRLNELKLDGNKLEREVIDSDVEEKLKELGEDKLRTAFKAIVGCDGKSLFTSIDEKTHGKERFNFQKAVILNKKETVLNIANYFGLSADPLFNILDNPIKRACIDLNFTYKELAEAIGYGENSVSNASRGEVSKAMTKAIELYTKIIILEEKLKDSEKIKSTLKEWLK
jgi:hypothetical protein